MTFQQKERYIFLVKIGLCPGKITEIFSNECCICHIDSTTKYIYLSSMYIIKWCTSGSPSLSHSRFLVISLSLNLNFLLSLSLSLSLSIYLPLNEILKNYVQSLFLVIFFFPSLFFLSSLTINFLFSLTLFPTKYKTSMHRKMYHLF